MSNICYKDTNLAIYGIILQKAINKVLSKIGISDEGITWVIFNEKPHMENDPSLSSIYLQDRYKYGDCKIDTKIIRISTVAIIKAPNYNILDVTQKIIQQPKNDFLADVIMDELAHITTKKDHGSKVYDDTLLYYHKLYYR